MSSSLKERLYLLERREFFQRTFETQCELHDIVRAGIRNEVSPFKRVHHEYQEQDKRVEASLDLLDAFCRAKDSFMNHLIIPGPWERVQQEHETGFKGVNVQTHEALCLGEFIISFQQTGENDLTYHVGLKSDLGLLAQPTFTNYLSLVVFFSSEKIEPPTLEDWDWLVDKSTDYLAEQGK